jgi:hypothetical protein
MSELDSHRQIQKLLADLNWKSQNLALSPEIELPQIIADAKRQLQLLKSKKQHQVLCHFAKTVPNRTALLG